MKVTKDMLHPQLQKFYPLKHLAFFSRSKFGVKLFFNAYKSQIGKNYPGLDCDTQYIKSRCGQFDIRTRIFRPENCDEKLPIMLYAHGGGYLTGVPDTVALAFKELMDIRPCVIVAPDYRKSIEHPYPAAFDDCYDALLWAKENADLIGGDANNIILAGHSAGGGLTAALALKARDTKDVDIAFQMPMYPMLDDTQSTVSARFEGAPGWDTVSNQFAWQQYLKSLKDDNKDIPCYAAPMRCKDFSNLPPTITYIGSIDPFLDETVNYMNALWDSDVEVAYEIFDGAFHAFEYLAPKTEIARQAHEFVKHTYSKFYDKYIK